MPHYTTACGILATIVDVILVTVSRFGVNISKRWLHSSRNDGLICSMASKRNQEPNQDQPMNYRQSHAQMIATYEEQQRFAAKLGPRRAPHRRPSLWVRFFRWLA